MATGLPLVLDLRDPWSTRRRLVEFVASPVWFALADRHERRAVERAALVVTNTPEVREDLAARYEGVDAEFLTVMNGWDDEALPPSRHGGTFVLVYGGAIYLDRDPRPLFRAVGEVVRELGLGPEDIRVRLIGDVASYQGVPTQRLAEDAGIGELLELRERVPRDELMDALAGASVLVSLPQDSPWAVPSKLFEYMRFDAWMLVFADEGTPSEVVLRGTGADVVAPDDHEGIVRIVRERYRAFAGGERPSAPGGGEKFSRRHQARLLFDALEGRVGPPPNGDGTTTPAGPRVESGAR